MLVLGPNYITNYMEKLLAEVMAGRLEWGYINGTVLHNINQLVYLKMLLKMVA